MTTDVTAGIYCRISLAGMGDTTKTDDQQRICRDLSDRLGWPVVKTYTDHSQSAWKKNRKRDGWDEMLADIEAGRISAVIVYHGDRLIRQPWDLEKLLNLAESKGVRLASPTGIRNLDNADDRFILRIEAAQACRQSDDTSRRKKQQHERWRLAGRVRTGGTGGRPFGFESDGITRNDAEARLIRKAAAMVLAGQSTGQAAAWLAATGTTTPAGNPWTHFRVRRMLLLPRYAGLMPDGASKAAWEPVIDRADWETIAAVLAANASAFPRSSTNQVRYLLSGIARCGRCGAKMASHSSGGKASPKAYCCLGCRRVLRSMHLLDAYVTGAVVRRLSHAENPAARAPKAPGLAAEFRALTDARAEAEAAVTDPANGKRLPLLLARLDSIDSRLSQLRDLAGDAARDKLIRQHAGTTREEFEDLPLHERRALVAACFDVVVLPAAARGAGFRPEDVKLTPLG